MLGPIAAGYSWVRAGEETVRRGMAQAISLRAAGRPAGIRGETSSGSDSSAGADPGSQETTGCAGTSGDAAALGPSARGSAEEVAFPGSGSIRQARGVRPGAHAH